ncbi:SWIM zinc finger [Paenibacillus uliginis N3/975]|uniref:SWIM zinc finger n=1 Tax=Paenibacillus uliginis N3/975 TaxID=1313296 RepID=A0A1X7HFY5_9BACL|nr:SWIM zinc finger family protein [Paenibacillus uliginis]SMF84879.1 SWIM zinc finger [Paenibacillus uliginis N3/975]
MTNLEAKFRLFAENCTEDYLIRYANKGLYKRSLKDIDQGVSVQYAWNASSVSCRLSEGTTCTLEDRLDQWQCSCPSERICKHVLIAILYYQKEHGGDVSAIGTAASEPAEASDPSVRPDASGNQPDGTVLAQKAADADASSQAQTTASVDGTPAPKSHVSSSRFQWLLSSDLKRLIKPYSAAVVEEALFRLGYPAEIEVIRDPLLLTVRLVSQQVEVSFTEEPDLGKALFKPKQAAGTSAKLEALLRYRKLHGLDDAEALGERAYEAKFSLQTVRECREILAGMLRTGLARLPQSFMAQLETLAVAAHSGNLPDIERSLRGIQGELQLFLNRHVRFSMPSLLDRITKLYLALQVLEQQRVSAMQQSQLIGSFRSKYFTVPELHLYGLGADAWETRSGYRGITYYFYGLNDQEVYTYSDVRATYYDNQQFSYTDRYASKIPWLPGVSFREWAGEELRFRNVKVNEERRLSSGEGAKLELLGRKPVEEVRFGERLMQDPAQITREEHATVDLFAAPRERLALVRIARIADQSFHAQTQELHVTVEHESGETLVMVFPYDKDWETAIHRLEKGYGLSKLEHFTAFVRIQGGRMFPISFLKEDKVISLKLDVGFGRRGAFARI